MNNQQARPFFNSGARLPGGIAAGPCAICLLFVGVSLMLMGTLAVATSGPFEDFGGHGSNPPRAIGITLLSFGGIILIIGIICLYIAKRAYNTINEIQQSNIIAGQQSVGPTITGATPFGTAPNPGFQTTQFPQQPASTNAPPAWSQQASYGQPYPPQQPTYAGSQQYPPNQQNYPIGMQQSNPLPYNPQYNDSAYPLMGQDYPPPYPTEPK